MLKKLKELPVIIYSLFIIIFGVYKYRNYLESNFMIMIVIFFVIMFLNNILIFTKVSQKIFDYLINHTRKFEIVFIVLMIFYLIIALIINVLIYLKTFENKISMEYFTFILLAFSISGYNCYIYTKELRKKNE
ncbi:hypothetical protein FACS189485_23080 [Spirochaetia bacterium]|nr:hypothetical protein FACS189485_23080 [Spirochaetia bacterium]